MKILTLALSCLTVSSAFAGTPCIEKLLCQQECSGALTLEAFFKNSGTNTINGSNPNLNCQNAYDRYFKVYPKCPGFQLVVVPPSGTCKLTTKSGQMQKRTSH